MEYLHNTQISRAFLYGDRKVFVQLYKQFVQCHMEFAVLAWSPWQSGDIQVLERVQMRAVRIVKGLQGTTYEARLEELSMRTLEDRRIRLDLVQTFKIIKDYDKVNCDTWFRLVGSNVYHITRSSSYHNNIGGNRCNTEIRRQFFSNRVSMELTTRTGQGFPDSTDLQEKNGRCNSLRGVFRISSRRWQSNFQGVAKISQGVVKKLRATPHSV